VPTEIADLKDDQVSNMRALAKEPGRKNIAAVTADLVAMADVAQQADILWKHLFDHDLHTIQARGATAAQFNRLSTSG
jgi:predicted methyltransferase